MNRHVSLGTQVSLWLLRVGVSVVARADILPVDDVLGKLREVAGEEGAAYIEAIDLNSLDARNRGLSLKAEQQVEVFGQAYRDFVAFVSEEEEKIVATAREVGAGGIAGGGVPAASAAPIATVALARRRSYETDMVLASRQKYCDEPQWAWVRRVNVTKWKDFESPAGDAAAEQKRSATKK